MSGEPEETVATATPTTKRISKQERNDGIDRPVALYDRVPKGIAGKLVTILEAAGTVPKKGHNRAQNYKFVRETDLVDMIRPIMAKEKLFLNLDVVSHELVEMGRTASGSTNRLTILTIRGTWVDAETGEVWPIPSTFVGYGADTGDKGVYKAMTGAEKYFLFKSFLVGTGDDPEGDEKTDRHAEGATGPVRVRRGQPSADQQRGGRSAKATGPQLNAITRLVREIGLTPEAFRALIGKETGLKVPEEAKIGGANGWMAQQAGGVAGKIIAALTELAQGVPGSDQRDRAWSEGAGSEGAGDAGTSTTDVAADESDDLPL
jgi:hypothetical protein